MVIGQARAQLVEPTVERLLAMGDHGDPSDPGHRLIVAYLRSARPVDGDCADHAGSYPTRLGPMRHCASPPIGERAGAGRAPRHVAR